MRELGAAITAQLPCSLGSTLAGSYWRAKAIPKALQGNKGVCAGGLPRLLHNRLCYASQVIPGRALEILTRLPVEAALVLEGLYQERRAACLRVLRRFSRRKKRLLFLSRVGRRPETRLRQLQILQDHISVLEQDRVLVWE